MVTVGERGLSHVKIVRYRPFKNTVIIESVFKFSHRARSLNQIKF